MPEVGFEPQTFRFWLWRHMRHLQGKSMIGALQWPFYCLGLGLIRRILWFLQHSHPRSTTIIQLTCNTVSLVRNRLPHTLLQHYQLTTLAPEVPPQGASTNPSKPHSKPFNRLSQNQKARHAIHARGYL